VEETRARREKLKVVTLRRFNHGTLEESITQTP
jgi:hypothetical protein